MTAGSPDSGGVLLTSEESPSTLLSAVVLPPGSCVAVDLLQPDVPVVIATGSAGEPGGWASALVREHDGQRRLRADLVRLAVVSGTDRWVSTELDENLLRADRALALTEAGYDDAAAPLFAAAGARLVELVSNELDQDSERPSAFIDELAVVLRAGSRFVDPLDVALRDLRRMRRPRGGATIVAGRALSPGAVRVDSPRDRDVTVPDLLLDPARIPARILRPGAEIRRNNGTWLVHCPATLAAARESSVARRLAVRAIDRRTARVVAAGPMAFDTGGPAFFAELRIDGVEPADVVVEVSDVLAVGRSRWSHDDRREVDALIRIQSAYTLARDAAALTEIGARRAAITSTALALSELGPPADRSDVAVRFANRLSASDPSLSTLWRGLQPPGSREQRPLLCELAAAVYRQV